MTHVKWFCTYCPATYVAYADLQAHVAAVH